MRGGKVEGKWHIEEREGTKEWTPFITTCSPFMRVKP
jgi:hypothetical protein